MTPALTSCCRFWPSWPAVQRRRGFYRLHDHDVGRPLRLDLHWSLGHLKSAPRSVPEPIVPPFRLPILRRWAATSRDPCSRQ